MPRSRDCKRLLEAVKGDCNYRKLTPAPSRFWASGGAQIASGPSGPGSLKLLSLTFYARCLMYNAAEAAGYPVEMLEMSQTISSTTAWTVLAGAALILTCAGMWLFARLEYRDDV